MTTKIYSRLDPSKLLHMIVSDVPEGRTDLVEPDQFIQCAALRLPKGTTFKPHKHNWNFVAEEKIAQESWFIVSGKVAVTFYDIDDTIMRRDYLKAGDTTFTLEGGHTYLILSDGSYVMEYKTGKYIDQKTDKTFI
jgi:hypothetical protein